MAPMARIITIEDEAVAVRARIVIDAPPGGHSRVTSVHLDAVNGSPGVTAESLHLLESVGLHLPRPIGLAQPSVEEAHVTLPGQHHEDALPERPAVGEPTRPAGEPAASADDPRSSAPVDTDAAGSPRGGAPAATFRAAETEDEDETPAAPPLTPLEVANRLAKTATAKAQQIANNGHTSKPENGEFAAQFKRFSGDYGALADHYGVDRQRIANWAFAARKAGALAQPRRGR